MLPHQGVVLLIISGISLVITLGFVFGYFGKEKRHHGPDTDEH